MKKFFLLFLLSGIAKCGFSQDADFYNLYFAGNAALSKGNFDVAIEKYNAALKLSQVPYVYFNRGNAYYGKKDYTNALIDYSVTIKLNTDYAEAYCQRGLVKNAMGDKTCCDDIKKAVKLDMESAKEVFKSICK
jgi:tetratricopeptide (TPR) repeat protein